MTNYLIGQGRNRWLGVLCALCAVVAAVRADSPAFTEQPSVSRSGEAATLTFGVSAPTDVEVAVLKDGKVIRHLAAGRLGDNPPAPFQKGLKQSLPWDLKDDDGKPVDAAGASVRVRLGMTATFDKIIGWSGKWLGELCGIFNGPDGTLYAMHRGDYLAHRHTWMINAYDRKGNYSRQVYPGPGDLPEEKREGWPWVRTTDGQTMPMLQHLLNRSFYPAALFQMRMFPVVTRDEQIILATGGKGGLRSVSPDIRGGRRLLTLNADGTVPADFIGPVFAPAAYGGFAHLALTPDEKEIYIAGLFDEEGKPSRVCHVVWKMGRTADAKPNIFLGTLFQPGTGGSGLNDPQGLAVDKDGNLYVADYGNDRVAVFKPDGSLLDEIPVNNPDQVYVSRKTGEIFVVTVQDRKRPPGDAHWYTDSHNWKLISVQKFASLSEKKPAAMLGPLPPRGLGGGAYLAMDDSGEKPSLYVGGLNWRDSSVHRLTDADGKLEVSEYIAGFDVWARKPEGDVGFTGDLAYANDTLFSSGPSSWGFRGAAWTRYDARTGAFKGLVELRDPKGESLKVSGHGELVSGKDGNLYSQVIDGTVFRFHGNGKAFPFPARSGFALGGLYQKHSRQTGLFASRDGTIYVPTGYQESRGEGRKPLNVIDRTRVVVFDADGNEISPAAVKVEQTRVAGLAADRQGNIYLGARTAPKDQQLPAWIDGRLPADATSQTRTTYQQVATIFKFAPSGGEIKPEEDGKWVTALTSPTPAAVANALWWVRGGLVPRKWACFCETTRFDIDGYGRLFIPDTLRFSVLVVDAAGNQVSRIGGYGNMDNRGPDSVHPRPAIAFAWPLSTRVGEGKLFVADALNCRLISVTFDYQAAAVCEMTSKP